MANRVVLQTALILSTFVSIGLACPCDGNENTTCLGSRWHDNSFNPIINSYSFNPIINSNSFSANDPGQFVMRPGCGCMKNMARGYGLKTEFGGCMKRMSRGYGLKTDCGGCMKRMSRGYGLKTDFGADFMSVFQQPCCCQARYVTNGSPRVSTVVKVVIGIIIVILIKSRVMSY